MNFSNETLKMLYTMGVGYGTETIPGRSPYEITVCANK